MKKGLLTIAAVLIASATSFGQGYVQASGNTGFTYDCDALAPTGISWSAYYPVCNFASENGGGGWDEAPVNELKFAWGQGGAGHIYDIMTFATPLDLSATANQILKITIRTTKGGNYLLKMEDAANTSLIDPIPLSLTTSNQTVNVTLTVASGQSLASVKKLYFYYENCPTQTQTSDDIFISNFSVGSPLVTGINNSSSVANANLFPNPSTGTTTISGELKSVADVKITLVDMLGQEVKVIAEERTSTINTTFDVSTLKKGIYSVVTNIDGAPSKSQMLVVR
jgi:hypothetical protein